jgi:hypothetical protein
VVAIDNRSSRIRGLETQPLFLHRLPDDVIEGVLVANFEAVPEPDRRLAVALAGGFLRIAIDICQRGWAAGMGSAKPKLADYYASRVDEADRPVLEALSLVTRVGWTGEVDQEWADLCALCGIPAEDGLDRARRLKEVPGFVGMGGRYLYVTPEAIAEIALEQAYRKWIEPCPSDFFDRVPASIEEVFLSRIARCSNQRLREAAAAYSQSWVAALSGDDLPDKKKLNA